MPYTVCWEEWDENPSTPEELAARVEYGPASGTAPLEGDMPSPELNQPARPAKPGFLKVVFAALFGARDGLTSLPPFDDTYRPDANSIQLMRSVAEELRNCGFEEAEIAYNGGNDEGFGEFAGAIHDGSLASVPEVVDRLLESPLAVAEADIDGGLARMEAEGVSTEHTLERRRNHTAAQRVKEWLDYFADETATILHGESWGTGPYCIAGRFRIDLKSGAIDDLELGDPPDFSEELEWMWNEDD